MASNVINVQVDISGIKDIEIHVKSVISSAVHNVQKALLAFGYNVQADAIETIQQGPPRSGVVYMVSRRRTSKDRYRNASKLSSCYSGLERKR